MINPEDCSFSSDINSLSTSDDSLSSTEIIGTSDDNDSFTSSQQHEYRMLQLNMKEITKQQKEITKQLIEKTKQKKILLLIYQLKAQQHHYY